MSWEPQSRNPPIEAGVIYVGSTLSHPGSASDNLVHALEAASGDILWATNIGGEQGFSFHPAFINGELLIVYSPEAATVALRTSDGSVAWEQPATFPIVDPAGAIYGGGDGVVVLDAQDGTPTTVLEDGVIGLAVTGGLIENDQLVLTGENRATGYDFATGMMVWRIQTTIPGEGR